MSTKQSIKLDKLIDSTSIAHNKQTLADIIYPVGSIYLAVNDTNPSTLFGGTWERIKDRFLLASGDSYSNGSTGGSSMHQHQYGFQAGGFYYSVLMENDAYAGLINYDTSNNQSLAKAASAGSYSTIMNANVASTGITANAAHYKYTANTSNVSNMPPYLAVYVWKRTA